MRTKSPAIASPLSVATSFPSTKTGARGSSPAPGSEMPMSACRLSPGPFTTQPITATRSVSTPEVFYAGGTATRDFSAADIVAEIAVRGVAAEFAASREWLIERIAAEARAGDLVIVMGARDPSLTGLAREVLARLGGGSASTL